MQAITNPTALDLSNEVKRAASSNDFMYNTLSRKDELVQLRNYIIQEMRRAAEEAAEEAAKNVSEKTAEKMLISAIQNSVPKEAIEAMRQSAGITESRLAELREQAK